MKTGNKIIIAVLVFLFITGRVGAVEIKQYEIKENTVWSGNVFVPMSLKILKGVTLTIAPGAIIKFGPGEAGLIVEGVLVAEGSNDQKIIFSLESDNPSLNKWGGIVLSGGQGQAKNRFSNCVIELAETGITAQKETPSEVKNCVFTRNNKAINISQQSVAEISDSEFKNNLEGGIVCEQANVRINNNRFEQNKNFAVLNSKGFDVNVENNFIQGHRYGIISTFVGSGLAVKNNVIKKNEFGIFVGQLANPIISNNTLENNGYGIYLTKGGQPKILMNEITKNKIGIYLYETYCSEILVVNDNNIYGNEEYEVSLLRSSMDYKRKVARREIVQEEKYIQVPMKDMDPMDVDKVFSRDFIDVKRNFWGDELIKEMVKKGPDANISKIWDFYDHPYDGEGVERCKEDHFLYNDWVGQRIEAAGAKL